MTDIERSLGKHSCKLRKIKVSENKGWLTHKLQCLAHGTLIRRSLQDEWTHSSSPQLFNQQGNSSGFKALVNASTPRMHKHQRLIVGDPQSLKTVSTPLQEMEGNLYRSL